MNRIVLDIEGDNFYDNIKNIWCFVTKNIDTGVYEMCSHPTKEQFERVFRNSDQLIMHNGIDFDLPAIEKVTGAVYQGKIFDTYVASCLLNPDRKSGHSLEAWGERAHLPKGDFNDFSKYTPEMMKYCRQDVEITGWVFNQLSPIIYYRG